MLSEEWEFLIVSSLIQNHISHLKGKFPEHWGENHIVHILSWNIQVGWNKSKFMGGIKETKR